MFEQLAHGDVQADHSLEEVAPKHRGDGGEHPALACRVEVDVGQLDLALGVVRGVRQVIEVEVRDDHVVRVLLRRVEPGVDAVVAVPAVEVDAGDQRILPHRFAHQRVELGESGDLAQVLLLQRRDVGVEGRRAAVILGAVAHATGCDGQFGRGDRSLVVQGLLGQRRVGGCQPRDMAQFAFEQMGFLFGRALQVVECGLAQVGHLRITNGDVADQIDADEYGFHQDQRDQGRLSESTPYPCPKTDARAILHDALSCAGKRTNDINMISVLFLSEA